MTILTKPSVNEKSEKVPLPFGLGGGQDEVAMLQSSKLGRGSLLQQQNYSSDVDNESMVFNRSPQLSCVKTILLFLISMIVMMMGILGGYTLYRAYAPSHSSKHLLASCEVPYFVDDNNTFPRFYTQSDDFDLNWRSLFPRITAEELLGDISDNHFFRENIEFDMSDDESIAKVDVPDFKDGRRGRFMHDFKENQSAIIDTTANRCFIMPLDHNTTLPPKSFLDLMQKMGTGYYNVDTERVRRTMRVVTPPITDLSLISERIANECFDMKIYMLENYVSGVFKREIKPITDAGKFAQFFGKGIVEFDLLNIKDIEEYENDHQKLK
ncbi:uncharacterized protein LOC119689054 [Teleopsis dalmanni]|uniref:uncharacterized protein LOC119689054 n=1 Tax=Teleopsis dalmanni TaxID=139649 RepID=UPI0018CE389E|nr:uncharacterized protein LOC119689054 [Teleopsis dalmanni]